jgi:phospholipase/carboxylesterase
MSVTEVLPAVEKETGPAPQRAVIWLHGLGADGHDFEPVVPELGLRSAVRFIFPHAPMRPVTLNQGHRMRAWYDIQGLDRLAVQDEQGIRESAAQVDALIAREGERGIAPGHIVLAGFSQGGAIALHAGIRREQPLAGIIALSTYLPLHARLAAERTQASATVPVLMMHGTHDQVLTCQLGQHSRDLLAELGHPVEWHEYPMAHQVCLEQLRVIGQWLDKVLA